MGRFVSLRFDGAVGEREREAAALAVASAGGEVTSWAATASHTYAEVRAGDSLFEDAAAALGARLDDPALIVLEITPLDAARLPALARALGGPGRPVGVGVTSVSAAALIVEADAEASLRLVVDVVDLEAASGRRITPLLPLRDETLTAFAAATLSISDLDRKRLIETYVEGLLGASG